MQVTGTQMTVHPTIIGAMTLVRKMQNVITSIIKTSSLTYQQDK
jgi:hypothetical protein